MILALTIACGLLAAWSGGSLWPSQHLPSWLTWLPEALLSLVVGYALYHINPFYAPYSININYERFDLSFAVKEPHILFLLVSGWFYLWFQTGHANALSWGVNANPKRKNTLTPLVDFIYRKGFGRGYSAVFFSVKGFLMTLPFGGLGALYWPLAYDIGTYLEQRKGWKNGKAHTVSELLSGVFLGLNLGVLLWLMTTG